MGLIARAASALRRLGGPTPSSSSKGSPRFTPLQEVTISEVTAASVRNVLRAHEEGDFSLSGAIAAHIRRDADLRGALLQRVNGLLGLPTLIMPATPRAHAKARDLAEQLEQLWPRMAPRPALADIVSDAVILGFGAAQVVEDWDEERGELVPRLDPWPPTHVSYQAWDRTWWAHAEEGLVQITPGVGWFLYAPQSAREPHRWGALLAVLEWFLRAQNASASADRFARVRGQGVWIAEVPSKASTDVNTTRWLASIKNLGSGGVIPAAQSADKAGSFNVRIEEAKGNAYEIFALLLQVSGARFRLAILGQNLTSNNDKVGTNASSSTGENVSNDVREADAETLGDALHEQLLKPWAVYQTGRREWAPWAGWDAEPEGDRAKDATTIATVAKAMKAWREELALAGRVLDAATMADRFGVSMMPDGTPLPALPDAAPPAAKGNGDGADDTTPDENRGARRYWRRGGRLVPMPWRS